MIKSPIVTLLGPKNRLGWAIRYVILALFVIGTVFAHDVLQDQAFHGRFGEYLGNMVMLGLPLYAVATGIMADLGRLRRQLIAAAESDPMTGLLQRPAFLDRVNRRLSQAGVMLMLDLDGLTDINAKHGHKIGDLCLMALAMRLRGVMGPVDIAGRIDGATIAVYLPGATEESAVEMARRLSDVLQVTAGRTHLEVTVSVGLTKANGMTPLPQLLKSADAALLLAKAKGPAQVLLSTGRQAA